MAKVLNTYEQADFERLAASTHTVMNMGYRYLKKA